MENNDCPDFESIEAAKAWIDEEAADPCVDNVRFAFEDDAEANMKYEDAVLNGCCGSIDRVVTVNGRKARVGCNYGH